MVHNRYLIRGGEDESFDSESALLSAYSHQVTEYIQNNEHVSEMSSWQAGLRTVWSNQDYRALRRLIREQQPDIIHVQNFFPLISPSVYYAAKAEKVPVVQSLRNYRLFCPSYNFFRDGHVCEDCMGKFVPWPGVFHACYRDSRAATGAVAAMLTVHRVMQTWSKMVDVYIALTQFARQKFIQGGLSAEKIVVKPNFVYPDPGTGEGRGGYALFVGRLSSEKGIDTLLAAWEQLRQPVPLKIVGDGPLADRVAKASEQLPGVEWLGRRPVEETYKLMGEAAFLVFPSEWYETFGRVAIEAFAKGTPVVAADIGAIAELVKQSHAGFYFRPGDPADLAAQVERASTHLINSAQMRQEARAEFEAKYTAEQNYQMLIDIYQTAIKGTKVDK